MTTIYHRPTTLDGALALLAADPGLAILAGGTDVYPARAAQAGWGARAQPRVIDIAGIDALRGITRSGDRWRLGALTTWADVSASALTPQFDGLKAAAREIGGLQIQNRGTIAGNICNASPAADGVPPLLTLDATVELASVRGRRQLMLRDFIAGVRRTTRANDEMVTAIEVPAVAGRGRFLKLGARRYLVISIVMVAGLVEVDADDTLTDVRLAVGACSPVACRLPRLEAQLRGRRRSDLADIDFDALLASELTPIDDIRASAAYRRHAAAALLRDLLAPPGDSPACLVSDTRAA